VVEPGAERVTEQTRRFEVEDACVFRGAGRGPTPAEEEAAARAGGVAPASVVDAYRWLTFRGANTRGEGRLPW
jgi:hypothetical protein